MKNNQSTRRKCTNKTPKKDNEHQQLPNMMQKTHLPPYSKNPNAAMIDTTRVKKKKAWKISVMINERSNNQNVQYIF